MSRVSNNEKIIKRSWIRLVIVWLVWVGFVGWLVWGLGRAQSFSSRILPPDKSSLEIKIEKVDQLRLLLDRR